MSDFTGDGLGEVEVDPSYEERKTREDFEKFAGQIEQMTDPYGKDFKKEETESESQDYDPFDGAEGTNKAVLITLMRIYDVLLAQYGEANDDDCEALMAIHAQGKLVASLPQLQL